MARAGAEGGLSQALVGKHPRAIQVRRVEQRRGGCGGSGSVCFPAGRRVGVLEEHQIRAAHYRPRPAVLAKAAVGARELYPAGKELVAAVLFGWIS